MAKTSKPVAIRSRREPVMVCKKCLKRAPNGHEIKRALKFELKRQRVASSRRPRFVLTGCFGICPKRAVVVASAATLHRGEYVLLAGSDNIDEASALLMPLGQPEP